MMKTYVVKYQKVHVFVKWLTSDNTRATYVQLASLLFQRILTDGLIKYVGVLMIAVDH